MALSTSLESYWKLDEASGNATDSFGSNTLTDSGSSVSGTGKINSGRDFERSSSQSLTINSNASVQTGDIDFTISAWVKLESVGLGEDQAIVAKGDDSDGDYAIQYRSDERFHFRAWGAGGYTSEGDAVATAFGAATTGAWYFLVGWHDSVGNTVNLQINNGEIYSAAFSTGVFLGGGHFGISWPNFNNWTDGIIDEVGFWKRVLTAEERGQLYNSGNGLNYENIIGPFSSTGVVRRPDYSLFPRYNLRRPAA